MSFAKIRQNMAQLADAANTHKMARGLGRAVHASDFAEAIDKPDAAARAMLAALKDAAASLEMQAAIYSAEAKTKNRKANEGLAAELRRNVEGYRAAIAQAEAAGIGEE